MKKGLLSLLALALTVVGCQNYDDQFAELTELIEGVQEDVDALAGVNTRLQSIEQTIGGLATAAELSTLAGTVNTLSGDVSDVSDDVDDINTAIGNLQGEIDDILADIEALGDVATQEDIDAINTRLDGVEEDLDELLAANAVINQNITINNVATLEYVESLISTATDDPNVIVNGSITVSVDEDDFNASQLARVNEVARKFATSLATVTITNTYSPTTMLDFANLAFIDSNATIDGSTNLVDGDTTNDVLRTISGDLTVKNNSGDINLTLLTSADDVTVPSNVTKLLLGNADIASIQTAGSGAGTLTLTKATEINTGDVKITVLDADVATDITIDSGTMSMTTEHPTFASVTAPKAVTLRINGKGSASGTMNISTGTPTIVRLDEMTKVSTITSGEVAQLHMAALTTAGTITSDAKIAALTKLAAGGIVMKKIAHFNAPAYVADSGVVSIVAATEITIKDYDEADLQNEAIYALAATDMTISGLGDQHVIAFTGSGIEYPKLKNLTVGGVADSTPNINSQTNRVSSTSEVLEVVNTSGTIDQLSLTDATKLKTLVTGGNIRSFELKGADVLTSATIGHGHIEGSDAAKLILEDNAKITGITTTVLDEVGTITLKDCEKLASFDFSSMITIPQLGDYTITVSNTGLTGSYYVASEVSTTTQAYDDIIVSSSFATLKPLMAAARGTSSLVSYTFDGDLLSSITTSTLDAAGAKVALGSATTTLEKAIIVNHNASTVASIPFSDDEFTAVE